MPPRRRRSIAVAVGLASVSLALFACEAILGIDEKPLRVAELDGSPQGDAGADADAGACDPNESRGCAASCPHDFCDDFDRSPPQDAGADWNAPSGFNNPILRADSGARIASPGNSPPQSLLVTASSDDTSSFGMIVTELAFADRHAGQTFDGVRVALDLRIDQLAFTGPAGPVADAGSAAVLGMLRKGTFPPKGIAVLVTTKKIYVDVAEDILDGKGENALADLGIDVDLLAVLTNWARVELFVGDRDRAVALGHTKCEPLPPGQVAAATVGGRTLGEACVAVPSGFGPKEWAETPVLLAGGLLFGPGSATFRSDNVVADFYGR